MKGDFETFASDCRTILKFCFFFSENANVPEKYFDQDCVILNLDVLML